MWTGRQTLASIERAIADLNGEESQLDTALRSAVGSAQRLRSERGEALRELARIKLDEMAAGRLIGNLDAGERRAVQILENFRLRTAAVIERREALLKEAASAEAGRHAVAKTVEEALAAVETTRANAEAKVQAAPDWRAEKAKLDEADAIAGKAEEKAASSETDLGAKQKPYDDDPLFTYLWRRRFGTASYSAGTVARYLDRIVANFIGYDDVRANYATLIEIPLRLREHANAKRALTRERQIALSNIERRAMVEAGIEAEERALAEARHRLAAAETTVGEKQGLLRKVDEERSALVAGGTDGVYNEALSTISAADSKDELATLYLEARRTPTGADDAIVRKLEMIDSGIGQSDQEIAGLRRTAQALANRRIEIQKVRERFRTAGYDHPNATFGNDGDIAEVLKRMLAGAVSSGALWDLLRTGYRYRQPPGRPDFGSPTFPLPFPIPGGGSGGTSGGGWREPSSRGGWSPTIDFPSGGSRDDDDRFTTGGSF